jgi:hypothetical protein
MKGMSEEKQINYDNEVARTVPTDRKKRKAG